MDERESFYLRPEGGQGNDQQQAGGEDRYRQQDGGQNYYQQPDGAQDRYQQPDGAQDQYQRQGGQNYYQGYQAPPETPHVPEDELPMTMGQWLLTLIVVFIPVCCVGFIMTLVWAFGNGNVNRRNFCRALLIVDAIGVLLVILYIIILAAAGAASYF